MTNEIIDNILKGQDAHAARAITSASCSKQTYILSELFAAATDCEANSKQIARFLENFTSDLLLAAHKITVDEQGIISFN